ncbi:portal protein [Desulfovibrio litoralis]|uniref:Bacteriophage head to tail connecting protein n=1 Tax=Desulfovibrio litoralis DSM 11393 TaxID=1121455 RepID=A0A1M7SWN3_9BACT|nr:portal protein [Desulfovibrio litoralis]SHN62937.1 Bacteriophage head to tail connecting protein [Desulfovibrio litoralis DSM 11393]
MKQTTLEKAKARVNLLEQHRQPMNEVWGELAKYLAPGRGAKNLTSQYDTLKSNSSSKNIFDATAIRAVRILASGMQSGLSSPARPWFRLRSFANETHNSGPIRRWLDEVENRIYASLARSNFYSAIHSLYTELAVFGSANLYMEACPEYNFRFECLSAGEYSWGIGENGRITSVARHIKVPLSVLASRFGVSRLSSNAQKLLSKDASQSIELVHLVEPRHQRKPNFIDHANLPYASILFEVDNSATELLHEGGFSEFPHLCARWEVISGEIYGRSPGLDTLPDIRMLQEMNKSQLLAVHKMVNPPMRVPLGFKQRLSLIPGAVNFVTPGQSDAIAPLYQIHPNLNALSSKIEDVRQSIKEGLFNDLFLMFAGGKLNNLTATEVLERSNEKLLLLGPVVERHQSEILSPLITRAFGILQRSGALPEMPKELIDVPLKIEFVSSLAQAQKIGTANSIRRLTADVASLAGLSPTVLEKLNFEQAIDELANLAGVPASMVNSNDELKNIRQKQQEQSTKAIFEKELSGLFNKKLTPFLDKVLDNMFKEMNNSTNSESQNKDKDKTREVK